MIGGSRKEGPVPPQDSAGDTEHLTVLTTDAGEPLTSLEIPTSDRMHANNDIPS